MATLTVDAGVASYNNEGKLVCRLPSLLAVHLKRFQADLRGRAKKISGPIAFPLDLDVAKFCDSEARCSCSLLS